MVQDRVAANTKPESGFNQSPINVLYSRRPLKHVRGDQKVYSEVEGTLYWNVAQTIQVIFSPFIQKYDNSIRDI